jgi:hypothetical protein
MKNNYRILITYLLITFICKSSNCQIFELNKNVFFNDITNLYVYQGQPFNGVLIHKGVGFSNSRIIPKKVIEIKNGKFDGLLYQINEYGDTVVKFTLKNNLVNGYFSFKYIEFQGGYTRITGNSYNDTLYGKITKSEYLPNYGKWINNYEGTYSKSGGHPIGKFNSYFHGKLSYVVKPFIDHIGLIKFNKNNIIDFINKFDFKISDFVPKFNLPQEGVYYVEPGKQEYVYINDNFVGYKRFFTNIYGEKYTTFHYFNGQYAKGFNINNYSKSEFATLMNLFNQNSIQFTTNNKNVLSQRKNFIDGKLEGIQIGIDGDNFDQTKIRTIFKNGIETGPRLYISDISTYYEIENIIQGKFDGKFNLFIKTNLEKPFTKIPYISCSYANGEIKYPVTIFFESGIKKYEFNKLDNDKYTLNEYFLDGSLKVSENIDEYRFEEMVGDLLNKIQNYDLSYYFKN